MKTFKYYLIFSFALIFVQCKEKTDPKSTATIDQEEQMIPPEEGNISVTVYDYNNNNTMEDVEILEVQIESDTIYTTNTKGIAMLTSVKIKNDYTFSKQDFISQTIRFVDCNQLDTLNVYLKRGIDSTSSQVNMGGRIFNSSGNPISNVTVISNKDTTYSQRDGSYSFEIQSQEGTFPIIYNKDGINGALQMKVNQDTILVDVFIDGFTNDTTPTKSEK